MAATSSPEKLALATLLEDIASEDAEVRTEAWRRAGEVGVPAISPLIDLMSHSNPEIARAAKRGLWQIVRHSSRPGAEEERTAVESEVVQLGARELPTPILREAIWILSEIGEYESVQSLVPLLSNEDLREDARMALERIPGDKSLAALKDALDKVPEGFRPNIAQSLRNRGAEIIEYPSVKLVPAKPTQVQPIK